MRTHPREVGLRLHTLGVMAGKLCSGSPNLSSESGCTCHSMFGVGCDGSLFANAPACDGGIVSGPVRNAKYSNAIAALPQTLLAMPFSVFTFFTLYCSLICRWSCRFSPTPGRLFFNNMLFEERRPAGPIPESCNICGEPIAPADRMVSLFAFTS